MRDRIGDDESWKLCQVGMEEGVHLEQYVPRLDTGRVWDITESRL